MIIGKHQQSVKSQLPICRGWQFSAVWIWAGVCLLAVVLSVLSGEPASSTLLAGGFGALPVFVTWLSAQLPPTQVRPFRGLIIAAWLSVGVLAVSLTGGSLSAPYVIFLFASLIALCDGDADLALEAGLFGTLTAFICLIAGMGGLLSPPPDTLVWLIGPISNVALVTLAGLMLWLALRQAGLQNAPPLNDQRTAHSIAHPQQLQVSDIPDTTSFAMIHVSAEGRIRQIQGNASLLGPSLRVGRIFSEACPGLRSDAPIRHMERPDGTAITLLHGGSDLEPIILALPTALSAEDAHRREIAKALESRTAFFAGLGHDLRTPLNAIIGFSDLMKAEIRGPLPDAYRDYAGLIRESGQDLLLLVDDILDLAKADASGHKLEPEPVELGASAASVMRQMEDQAARAEVSLTLSGDDEVWAHADARAVRQIWQNLISNAIKYSDPGSTVTLTCAGLGEAVCLAVEDQGAGMSEADLARIAEPFAQGSNAKGRTGTGLGLAVVKSFADLHGGQVQIDTGPQEGTRITVTLPAAKAADLELFDKAAQ